MIRVASVAVLALLGSAPLVQGQVNVYELQRVCNLGRETPISVRGQCARYGFGGWGGGREVYRQPRGWDDGYRRGPSGWDGGYYRAPSRVRQDLGYLCSLGRETPYSVRGDCVRYGYW